MGSEQGAKNLQELLDRLDEETEDGEPIGVETILDAFGSRAYGPMIAIPSIVAVSPVGAIPGVPTILGVVMALVTGQRVLGLGSPWIPSVLRDRSVDHDKWERAHEKLRPWAARVDRVLEPRLPWVTGDIGERVLCAFGLFLAAAMIPLELIPFAVIVPGASLLAIGLGISGRDGVLALVGAVCASLTLWLLLTML